jgi:hypothetical protein
LAVAMADTAERGAAFSDQDRVVFLQLIEKFDAAFGASRVSVPKTWGDGIVRCR